jgi:8-oxo-dGTP pyrophosphatase MutT (NUDIX family)
MAITVYHDSKSELVDDPHKAFKDHELVQAAGGVAQNDKGQILLIFRKGKWDLPKGKLEGNEPIELCADREVKEETNLHELQLRRPLIKTYHTYREKGRDILKETYWFLFDAPGDQEVQPQTDEQIFKVEWVSRENLGHYTNNTYPLIIEVLQSAGF